MPPEQNQQQQEPRMPLPTKPSEPCIESANHRVATYALLGFVALSALVLLGYLLAQKYAFTPEPQSPQNTDETAPLFPDVRVEAKAVYVYDIRTDHALFEKEAYEPMPLASISKVLTALVVQEALPKDTVVTVSARAINTEGDNGLTLGEQWYVDDLITYMLVTSSNDAATALAEAYESHTGIRYADGANTFAKKHGLSSFSFVNAHGLDEWAPDLRYNAGSAADAATLFSQALANIPELMDATRFATESIASLDRVHDVKNTNAIVDDIPFSIGSKTGFTDSAGGNLAMSFDATIGRPVVIVVLGSSREGRFSDMQALAQATREYFGTMGEALVH